MPVCALKTCKIPSYRVRKLSLSISFHLFPKNISIRHRWLSFCGIKDGPNLYLCSQHFLRSDYENRYMDHARQKLLKNAVPTIRSPPPEIPSARSQRAERKNRSDLVAKLIEEYDSDLLNHENQYPSESRPSPISACDSTEQSNQIPSTKEANLGADVVPTQSSAPPGLLTLSDDVLNDDALETEISAQFSNQFNILTECHSTDLAHAGPESENVEERSAVFSTDAAPTQSNLLPVLTISTDEVIEVVAPKSKVSEQFRSQLNEQTVLYSPDWIHISQEHETFIDHNEQIEDRENITLQPIQNGLDVLLEAIALNENGPREVVSKANSKNAELAREVENQKEIIKKLKQSVCIILLFS
ncbi:uncharacterized protein LOC110678813 [Aedes aegypti]|uniref:Uncharacterized protein n=1 Tax=Aedes aegypti TaxID=7159 RepID=A0A6I8U481_AEDAE|nr:uncharacterized protein LOC110678813 [Aedes aegypti]